MLASFVMKRLATAISAILIIGAGNVPTFQTGNSLLRLCEGDLSERIACSAYIQGVSDEWEVLRSAASQPPCLSSVESRRVTEVVVQFLRSNPSKRTEMGAGLAMQAIAAAWKCR
jgi:hypothetical protein